MLKFQLFVWSIVLIFVYTSLFAAQRNAAPDVIDLSNIPASALTILGLSVTTLVAAKAITTTTNFQTNKTAKLDTRQRPTEDRKATSMRNLVTDDAGNPDLTKVHMLVWTVVAALVYISHASQIISEAVTAPAGTSSLTFPDIEMALVILLAFGHATYLGNKLVSSDKPQLSRIRPPTGDEASVIKLSGSGFGSLEGGSQIKIDGLIPEAQVTSWTDASIEFMLPPRHPDSTSWIQLTNPVIRVSVGVGALSSNEFSFRYQSDVSGLLTIPDQQFAMPHVGKP